MAIRTETAFDPRRTIALLQPWRRDTRIRTANEILAELAEREEEAEPEAGGSFAHLAPRLRY